MILTECIHTYNAINNVLITTHKIFEYLFFFLFFSKLILSRQIEFVSYNNLFVKSLLFLNITIRVIFEIAGLL